MAAAVEVDEVIIRALRASPEYSVEGRPDKYVAVQNPWRVPIELRSDGAQVAHVSNADDWIAAPQGFSGSPRIEVYTASEWLAKARASTPNAIPAAATSSTPATAAAPPPIPPLPAYGTPQPPAPVGSGEGLAIGGLVAAFVLPIVGLILSIVALVGSSKTGSASAKGLSIAGVTVGAIGTLITLLFGIAVLAQVLS